MSPVASSTGQHDRASLDGVAIRWRHTLGKPTIEWTGKRIIDAGAPYATVKLFLSASLFR